MTTPESARITELRVQEAKTRLAGASAYLPGHAWLPVETAAGCWIYDILGQRYLDFGPGGAVSILGHNASAPTSVLREQMGHYLHGGTLADTASFYSIVYAKALAERFPDADTQPRQVLVCGSVEEARMVLSQFASEAVMLRLISPSHTLDGGLVQHLVYQAKQAGKIVVADETQTGFGRTGTFLAADRYNFVPDAVLLGPAGGGGLPFAALVAPAELFATVGDLSDRPMVGNPAVSATAWGVLAGVNDVLYEHVATMGALLATQLRELHEQFPRIVTGSTGVGLLQQLKIAGGPEATVGVRGQFRTRGLLTGPGLVLTPPLTVCEDEIRAATELMAGVFLEMEET